MKLLYTILNDDGIISLGLCPNPENATTNSEPQCKLWPLAEVMCLCRFIDYNKGTTAVPDVRSWEAVCMWVAVCVWGVLGRHMGNLSTFLHHLAVNLKLM